MLWLSVVFAAPTVVATHAADVPVATRAWAAAVACTGWEPGSIDQVEIHRGAIHMGYRGVATDPVKGVFRIDLDENDPRLGEVIAHEIAHAWVHAGPTALVEGRAELLADCIVHNDPGLAPLQWDDGRMLATLPRLQDWDQRDDHGPSVNLFQRTDAYLGAARFMRLASLVVPHGSLWPQDEPFGWDELDRLLVAAGSPAQGLRELLDADGITQAKGLSDGDGDGLPLVGELLLKTDPERFDSDGDGWWDGAAVTVGSRPLPFDGTPVCSGFATPAIGGVAKLQVGGNLRGSPAPTPALRSGDQVSTTGSLEIHGKASILIELRGVSHTVSGGLWGVVDGEGLEPDEACVQSERYVVWALEPHLRRSVPAFGEAVKEAVRRLDQSMPSPEVRLAIVLGGPATTVEGPLIRISSHDLARQSIDELALQAVAMRRVWDASAHRNWADVDALRKALERAGPGKLAGPGLVFDREMPPGHANLGAIGLN